MIFHKSNWKKLKVNFSSSHIFSRFISPTAVLGVLLIYASGFARAEESRTQDANALFQLLDELPKQLAGINSVASRANLSIVVNREYLGRPEDYTHKHRVIFKRAGSSVRVDIKKLDQNGEGVENAVWLSTAQQNVHQVNGHAMILDPKLNSGRSFIPPYDPIGWIFSFANDDLPVSKSYPLVADLASLSAPEVWQALKQQADLQSLQKNSDGGFSVTFRKPSGSVNVTFIPVRDDLAEKLLPSEVKFFNKEGQLIWSGKVTEWQTVGRIPTPKSAACMTTFNISNNERMRVATWNWSEIESDFRPFNEEDLSFDPMAATEIFDQVTSTTITVPK